MTITACQMLRLRFQGCGLFAKTRHGWLKPATGYVTRDVLHVSCRCVDVASTSRVCGDATFNASSVQQACLQPEASRATSTSRPREDATLNAPSVQQTRGGCAHSFDTKQPPRSDRTRSQHGRGCWTTRSLTPRGMLGGLSVSIRIDRTNED